ncbi:MAG: hypothetical protein H6607_05170 [Flavobacteriales bacterium]|nr:hypothetical protein [Flavobacteriales bacterium]
MKKSLIALSLLAVVFSGCDDDPAVPVVEEKPIVLTINHTWNTQELKLKTWYTTDNGDSIYVSNLRYHINNFVLIDDAGNEYADEKYYLIDFVEKPQNSLSFDLAKGKKIAKIRFTLGVADSAVNASGALLKQFLDPMSWGMASGYINFKFEGNSPSSPTGNFYYHIGGYQPSVATARTLTLDVPGDALEQILGKNTINLNLDLEDFFHSPNPIDISTLYDYETVGQPAVMISQNFDSMFSLSK